MIIAVRVPEDAPLCGKHVGDKAMVNGEIVAITPELTEKEKLLLKISNLPVGWRDGKEVLAQIVEKVYERR